MTFYKPGDFGRRAIAVFTTPINPITMKSLFTILVVALGLFAMSTACSPSKDSEKTAAGEATTTTLDTAQYKKQGMEIAMGTFKVLSGQLKAAMQEGGVKNAAQYCNTVAYPLVDSLSGQYNWLLANRKSSMPTMHRQRLVSSPNPKSANWLRVKLPFTPLS